jgi:hypothetical protein
MGLGQRLIVHNPSPNHAPGSTKEFREYKRGLIILSRSTRDMLVVASRLVEDVPCTNVAMENLPLDPEITKYYRRVNEIFYLDKR